LVVDVDDGGAGAVLASATGTTTGTSAGATPVTTVLATIATATSATTTTVWTVEASLYFEVDFVFLLGTSLGGGLALRRGLRKKDMGEKRWETYLANKVGILLFVLGKGDGIFPDVVVCSLVGLAGVFKLGDEAVLFLLLSEILVEGKGIVVLLGLAFSARAAFGFSSIALGCRRGSIGGWSPSVGGGWRSSTPVSSRSSASIDGPFVGGLCSSIYLCGSLGFEFSVAVGASPGLLDLLVRVAGSGIRAGIWKKGRETHV
jgi:hypothetical protein